MKRFQQMEAKKAHANKVREGIRLRKEDFVNVKQKLEIIETTAKPVSVPESDSDDEVYIYPPEEPTVISSEDEDETNVPVEKEPEPIDNLHDGCDAINVGCVKRLSRHDDPFGDIDVARLNTIISANPSRNLPPVNKTADHFAKPQRANRNSLKRSHDVSETDFAATDVYESESSDLSESNAPKGRKVATVLSESEGSDVDTSKRSKRMRKRRKSGSNRGSDCISSDDSPDDSDDEGEAYLEPEKTNRPYYLHRGEGVFNAVTKYSKRVTSRRNDQNRDGNLEAVDSSEDSETNGVEEEQENGNWVEKITTENVTGTLRESENVDRDVVMKELIEPDSAVVNKENPNEISLNKLRDEIILHVTDASDKSTHLVHDSDSNCSFGESKLKGKEQDRHDAIESPDYIPLPPHIDSSDLAAASDVALSSARCTPSNSSKIFLSEQNARLLLLTDAGSKFLSDASITHQVKVRMDWENLRNVLVVVGSKSNQNKFHADLIRFSVKMCKKTMHVKNDIFKQIPKSKMALILFIREQFALLEQPLGNVKELYRDMKRNENLKSKNGTIDADRARKNLNIILMGRAGLRDGRLHLAGLECNLKCLLNNNKDMMTTETLEEIYQHYRYVFSAFEHDDYPNLISEYEEVIRSKTVPPLNIDKNLLEIKISVKDDANVDLNRAKQKMMRTNNDTESQNENQESTDDGPATVDAISVSETKKSTTKTVKQDQRTLKQESKANNGQTETVESDGLAENSSNLNQNAVWSLKCKDIVEQCRRKYFKSSRVVDKLNTILEKASRNELSYADYKNLEIIVNTLNGTID
ncbi:uncharacterized protein LOC119070968 isoform X2 [Bradysia coprophila]|nr:uncharacterized protein LOC119070968 isoform X2 [Bradysia coprophila]